MARAKPFGAPCANAEIGKYMGTASVARDILEIVERVEEHNQKSLLKVQSRLGPKSTEAQTPLLNQKEHANVGTPMLQYFSFSYGDIPGEHIRQHVPRPGEENGS